ncbi:MAG: HAMP domain-containing sensor histidine kinase [Gemmataceae bacterium]
MSLTNRLSLFFLVALAVALAGFSLTLHLLARAHLRSQLDERLDTSMKTLVAAVEVHPGDVQWEPLERRITLGEDTAADQPRWALYDLSGRPRDRSLNLAAGVGDGAPAAGGWRVLDRRMCAGVFTPEPVEGPEGHYWVRTLAETPLGHSSAARLPDDRTFRSDGLVITVAVSEAPAAAMLGWLAFAAGGVSVAVWISAALCGRWLCRRALRQITQMAASARSIRLEPEPARLLDAPPTRDELEDLGRAFNELLTDLRESLERQRRFTGDASHQLRTPLTAMLASVDVALRHDRSPDEYKRVLEVVRRRGGQLRQIIESLLFLARADGATPLATPERVELNDWCRTCLDAWAEHARANDFTFRASANPVVITTHPALLGQVVDNLLDNACKYSEPGTSIGVSLDATPDYTCLTVSDSGSGIAFDHQALIFEPFYRAPEARWDGRAGVGLGLAVVRRLAAILGARVEVRSEPGKGSRFSIFLSAGEERPVGDIREERVETAQTG